MYKKILLMLSLGIIIVIGLIVATNKVQAPQQVVSGVEQPPEKEPIIAALLYHHFSENMEDLNDLIVHPDHFREQVRRLKQEGFEPIKLQELRDYMQGKSGIRLPEKSVIITIDDGYRSNYELIYPILEEEQFYATIFVVSSSRGKKPDKYMHFNWEEAKEMYDSGYIEIQNHSYQSHYKGEGESGQGAALTTRLLIDGKLETEEEYLKRITDDLQLSKTTIEQKTGNAVFALAFPYGDHNQALIDTAKGLGHDLMFTVKEGIINRGDDPNQLPRINVPGRMTGDALIERINKYMTEMQ